MWWWMVDCLLNFLRQWVKKCYTTFTHSCSCLASPLVWTFVRLCLCAKELFSHAYEHSHVHTHNANCHSFSLTRIWKTASRGSTTNGETNDATNDEANMWLVSSSFALLFASPLVRMCKCGISWLEERWQPRVIRITHSRGHKFDFQPHQFFYFQNFLRSRILVFSLCRFSDNFFGSGVLGLIPGGVNFFIFKLFIGSWFLKFFFHVIFQLIIFLSIIISSHFLTSNFHANFQTQLIFHRFSNN